MSITCDASAITPNAVPSPSSAVITGRPIARTEPKAINSTTIAAASPTAVAAPSDVVLVSSIAWPPSSTWRLGASAARAAATTCSTAGLGSAAACSSKVTVAKAIRPSREIACRPPAA